MESNECICINYFVRQLQAAINSLARTTLSLQLNSNLPSTDSGYVNQSPQQLNPQGMNNTWLSLDNGLFALLILGAILAYFLSVRAKKQSTLK
jgi:hypothetical protein